MARSDATTSASLTLRRATIHDVPVMAHIINNEAELGNMLPKSYAALYENLRDFQVAVAPAAPETQTEAEIARITNGSGQIIAGVCGLSIIWANLAEVFSLAVAPGFRGKGVGSQLVRQCLNESHALGIRKVMTLTYEQSFFERLKFSVVDRQQLPLKVWSECVQCPKNQACDEIAMIYIHADLPVYDGPNPAAPPQNQYILPVIPHKRS